MKVRLAIAAAVLALVMTSGIASNAGAAIISGRVFCFTSGHPSGPATFVTIPFRPGRVGQLRHQDTVHLAVLNCRARGGKATIVAVD